MKPTEIARSIIEETGEVLPDPIPLDMEVGVEIFRDGQSIERAAWMQMGYAAACVELKHGEGSLAEFAREVDLSESEVRNLRRVYTRVHALQGDTRVSVQRGLENGALSYSHLLAANPLEEEDYAEVLDMALNEGWSKRRVAEESAQRRGLVVVSSDEEENAQTEQKAQSEEERYVQVVQPCRYCGGSGNEVTTKDARWGKRKTG